MYYEISMGNVVFLTPTATFRTGCESQQYIWEPLTWLEVKVLTTCPGAGNIDKIQDGTHNL